MPDNFTPNITPAPSNQPTNPVPGMGDSAPVPPMMENQGGVKNFIINYKWYILGAAGVAAAVTLVGIFSYEWYFKPISKPIVQSPTEQNVVENSTATGTEDNVDVALDESGQPVGAGQNVGGAIAPAVNGNGGGGAGAVAPANGNGNGGAAAPVAGNNGAGVAQPPVEGGQAPAVVGGGDNGAVQPPAGNQQPPANGGAQAGAGVVDGNNVVGGVQIPNANVVIPGNNVAGQAVANPAAGVAPAGNLLVGVGQDIATVTVDQSSPKEALILDNQTVDLLTLKIASKGSAFKLKSLMGGGESFAMAAGMRSVLILKSKTTGAEIGRVSYENLPEHALVEPKFVFENLNLDIPANGSQLIVVSMIVKDAGAMDRYDGHDLQTLFGSAEFTGADNKTYIYSEVLSGNHIYVYKNYPVFSRVVTGTNLSKGTNTFFTFKIKPARVGTIGWRKIVFDVMSGSVATGHPAVNMDKLKLYRSGLNGALVEIAGLWQNDRASVYEVNMSFDANAEQQINTETTYILKGEVLSNVQKNDFVSVKINRPSLNMSQTSYSVELNSGRAFSFLWSGLVDSAHSGNTLDWHNDYWLPGLPTTEQKLTAPIVVEPVVGVPVNPVQVPVLP